MKRTIQAFLRHLEGERNASAHTIRAHAQDLAQFAAHVREELRREGRPRDVDHLLIRSFLARLHVRGLKKGAAGDAFRLGERWEFYGSYPFLRVALNEGDAASVEKFCRDCHADWSMTHSEVESWDGGYKSHPVGVSLSANGKTYDRAQSLDGNGVAQAGLASPDVDANATNDIKLDATGKVQCLSCHGVHYAVSNTQTVDAP